MASQRLAEDEEKAGSASLDGWFYQCDVSVWAALALLVVKGAATSLRLEPASQEDLEAELEPPVVASEANHRGRVLVVQAKLRRSGQWNISSMKTLVNHGTKRLCALKRLEDPDVDYLLVTSADVCSELGPLLIEDFLEDPSDMPLPDSVFAGAPATAAGRFAILGQHTERRVTDQIDKLLMTPLLVPRGQLNACRDALRTDAIARMREGNVWTRAEVEAVIRRSGGVLSSDRQIHFVAPQTWPNILKQMNERHAVVLTGPSGTGKTMVAQALMRHFQAEVPGLECVKVEAPAEIQRRDASLPTLIYIDDPWGKYELVNDRFSWSSELDQLLPRASAQRMVVVTSRSDILSEVQGARKDFLRRWEMRIEPDHYGEKQRRQLYESRVPRLPGGALQTAAIAARSRALDQLATPFEIDRFFALLKERPVADHDSEGDFVTAILRETQTHSIETEIGRLIQARQAVHCASVIWALLAARGGLSRNDIPGIRRALSAQDPAFREGLEELLNALLAGGYLRQSGSEVIYAHPRVEGSLMAAMRAKPGHAEDTLSALAIVLVRMDRGRGSVGVQTAARVFEATLSANIAPDYIDEEVQTAIDAWLEAALSEKGGTRAGHDEAGYPSLLTLAAATGSAQCMAAEVARWLRPVRVGGHFFMRSWKRPRRSDDWYRMVGGYPFTKVICERFLREVLTAETRGYPKELVEEMDRLSLGLEDAWRDAALAVVDKGYMSNVYAIALGAMRSIQHREQLLAAALAILPSTPDPDPDERDWAYVDGHYDGDYGDDSSPDDDGFCATELLSAYVAATRRDNGWLLLVTHPQALALREPWVDEIRQVDTSEVGDEEMTTLLGAVSDTRLEVRLWSSLTQSWRPRLADTLAARLMRTDGDADLRGAAIRCALMNAPEMLALEVRARAAHPHLLVQLAYEAFACVSSSYMRKRELRRYRAFARELPGAFSELAMAFTTYQKLRHTRLSQEARSLVLHTLQNQKICKNDVQKGALRAFLLWMAAVNGFASEEAIAQALFGTQDHEEAQVLVRAAIEMQVWPLVEQALRHPRADARKLAFEALVQHNEGEVPALALDLVNDDGSRVRLALVQALSKHPERFVEALVSLCTDTWSHSVGLAGDDSSYPIAQHAAKALARLTVMPEEYVEPLVQIALATSDSYLRFTLFEALACSGGDTARALLSDEVFSRTPGWRSIDAANALFLAEPVVEPAQLSRATRKWFLNAHARLATATAVAVGRCAAPSSTLTTARWFAESSTHRVLLVALGIGARARDEALAHQVLEHLPPGHAARAQWVGEAGKRLPHDALDDLGAVRVVNAVRDHFRDWIEPRPRVAAAG